MQRLYKGPFINYMFISLDWGNKNCKSKGWENHYCTPGNTNVCFPLSPLSAWFHASDVVRFGEICSQWVNIWLARPFAFPRLTLGTPALPWYLVGIFFLWATRKYLRLWLHQEKPISVIIVPNFSVRLMQNATLVNVFFEESNPVWKPFLMKKVCGIFIIAGPALLI